MVERAGQGEALDRTSLKIGKAVIMAEAPMRVSTLAKKRQVLPTSSR